MKNSYYDPSNVKEPNIEALLKLEDSITDDEFPYDSEGTTSVSSLTYYTREIYAIPLLSQEETLHLALLKDDLTVSENVRLEAFEKLIKANLRLVPAFIRYLNVPISSDTEMLDLIQSGNEGLCTAAQRYDPAKGTKFSSYAYFWIRKMVLASIPQNTENYALPKLLYQYSNKIRKVATVFFVVHGREPTPEEISRITKIPLKDIETLQKIVPPLSLNETINNEEGEPDCDLIDFIPDNSFDLHSIAEYDYLKENLLPTLKTIFHENPRTVQVLSERYGLEDNAQKTLEKVGEIFGFTTEGIRQIEKKALKTLKKSDVFCDMFKNLI